MQVPSAVYASSKIPFTGTPDALEYPAHDRRKVLATGSIGFNTVNYFLTSALAGWDIGLRQLGDGRVDVRFASLSLGIIDPKQREFLPAVSDLMPCGSENPT